MTSIDLSCLLLLIDLYSRVSSSPENLPYIFTQASTRPIHPSHNLTPLNPSNSILSSTPYPKSYPTIPSTQQHPHQLIHRLLTIHTTVTRFTHAAGHPPSATRVDQEPPTHGGLIRITPALSVPIFRVTWPDMHVLLTYTHNTHVVVP